MRPRAPIQKWLLVVCRPRQDFPNRRAVVRIGRTGDSITLIRVHGKVGMENQLRFQAKRPEVRVVGEIPEQAHGSGTVASNG
jgi:hypothetical protein